MAATAQKNPPTVAASKPLRAQAEQQISAFLANKPGVVARLCAALAERDVNIQAMTVMDTVDIGTMRMVVDKMDVAREALNSAGAAYVEVPVIAIPIPNEEGGFARIAGILAAANINIEYFYATSVPGTDYSLGIFRVSDHQAALELDFNGTAKRRG
ncbi:MAG: ACT domain-containing protein [Planctomycetes bacterium]|nr:ACT domain-containing protein [Planctomycetota bacterium]MBI3835878.1 ACT domain-containing protein [Planctomycetota bacterium]